MKTLLKSGVLIGLLVLSIASARAETIEMEVNGLVCAFCAQGIEKKISKLPATADILVNLEHRLVAVTAKPGQSLTDDQLTQAITEAGYTTVDIVRSQRSLEQIRAALKGDPK